MNQKPIKETKDRILNELNEPAKIAKFYGFEPITPPTIEKQDVEVVKNFDLYFNPAENSSILRTYFEEKMMALPQPCMFYCERPFPGAKEKKRPLRLEASLISLGSSRNVCECLSIQTAISILNSLGYKDLEVEINSVGNKDSMNDFQKKIILFVKKNFNSFPADLRQAIKKDVLAILKEKREIFEDWQKECPKSIDFLSEESRQHLKEALEFLEVMEIPYQINHHLMGDPEIVSETIFSIVDTKNNKEQLAFGYRFNRLAKKIGYKKELPSSVLTISAKLKKNLKKIKAKKIIPQFYLVQFGNEAKLRSFLILEELYKAGIHVTHAIAKNKLSSQMAIAETSSASYIILIGQKEALENSVLIRNILTRSQEIVPIPLLATKIKELIKI